MPSYVNALCQDIAHSLTTHKDSTLDSIFFGGGTPSLMPARFYERIFATIHSYARVSGDCEISLEANINHLSLQWCKDMIGFGANRLSVGIQSFNKHKLAFLEREHSAQEIAKSMENAYNAGFKNLSCDLIIDTPLDSMQLIESDIARARTLPINHISVYALSIDKGSRFATQKMTSIDASESEFLSFYARDVLQDAGFSQYEVSNYTKNNTPCKHNLGYWQGCEYLGCGASAVGRVGQIRSQAYAHLSRYIAYPLQRVQEALKQSDLRTESIMLGLRCIQGVDMSLFTLDERSVIQSLIDGRKCRIEERENGTFLVANELFLSDEITTWLLRRL